MYIHVLYYVFYINFIHVGSGDGIFFLPRTQRLEVNIFHYNSGINVCSKCSAWDLALAFLQHMPCISIRPDVVSYNAVMGACGEASRWQVVLSLSNGMPLVNLISFNTAIKAFDRWEGEKLKNGRYATAFRKVF